MRFQGNRRDIEIFSLPDEQPAEQAKNEQIPLFIQLAAAECYNSKIHVSMSHWKEQLLLLWLCQLQRLSKRAPRLCLQACNDSVKQLPTGKLLKL
jgi:hypothetical protein